MEHVYFDHAATTPPRPEVIAALEPYLWERWGNPSSFHAAGARARDGIELARRRVATLLGAQPEEIVFTSGGTEADNQALVGAWLAHRDHGDHLITTEIEHRAVLQTARFLEGEGVRVTYLPVDRQGIVNPDAVRAAITDGTFLVSVMHANNEIGSLQPIAEIGALCRARGVLFHTDAVQTVGPSSPRPPRPAGGSCSPFPRTSSTAPRASARCSCARACKFARLLHGGGHEQGLRAGTHNVIGIVGLGEAAPPRAEGYGPRDRRTPRLLRDRLIEGVLAGVPGSLLTGSPVSRLPGNASFCLPHVDGRALLAGLDAEGFAVSSGSACSSGSPKPSHVLEALGLPPELSLGSLRISLGRSNTREQVDRFLEVLPAVAAQARAETCGGRVSHRGLARPDRHPLVSPYSRGAKQGTVTY